MVDFNKTCLGSCNPPQIITFNIAFLDISTIVVYDDCENPIDMSNIKFGYSIDSACWSCYMSFDEAKSSITDIGQDVYIRLKVTDKISKIDINGNQFNDYSTQLEACFNFSYSDAKSSPNTFNPYANLSYAISLQQNLSDTVANMFGIPVYYFKLSPNMGSRDITFKEYTLMDVEAVKQIKIVIPDGQMPSAKPEFSDFGLDWQSDWETEISKTAFATAFGINAQPMEGDLVYIPLMKRMWMVNEAYEEKNQSLMWVGTTFKVALVKYQEKDSVNLGDTQDIVNTFVKNKYDDLFGDQDESNDAGINSTDAPKYAANNLYPVFESDATRKYVSCDSINISGQEALYYKGTLISDSRYEFANPGNINSQVVYQSKYCGTDVTISFIIYPNIANYSGTILSMGTFNIDIEQSPTYSYLYVNKSYDEKSDDYKCKLKLSPNSIYFVVLRYSKDLNIVEFSAVPYTYNKSIPKYKLNSSFYYFDMDNSEGNNKQCHIRYNKEFIITEKSEASIHSFFGWITNIKIYDYYFDGDFSEVLQTYPTNQHLIINDTARNIVDGNGVSI